MKLSNHILKKTLEQLEKDIWENPIGETFLITRCCELRKKKLEDFTIENLRIMIGQQIGLQYLIPIAIEKLQHNPMAMGDFYEGDLLRNVLRINTEYWNENKEYWQKMKEIIKEIDFEICEIKSDLSKFNYCKWNKNYKR
jgi:hypothetical protein